MSVFTVFQCHYSCNNNENSTLCSETSKSFTLEGETLRFFSPRETSTRIRWKHEIFDILSTISLLNGLQKSRLRCLGTTDIGWHRKKGKTLVDRTLYQKEIQTIPDTWGLDNPYNRYVPLLTFLYPDGRLHNCSKFFWVFVTCTNQ